MSLFLRLSIMPTKQLQRNTVCTKSYASLLSCFLCYTKDARLLSAAAASP